MTRPRVLAFILAGGKGERLYPLTRERGKPAVPFGGKYRIIDFVLSNFVNSGVYALYVLVQYKAQSLIEHLRNAWRLGGLPDHFVIVVPPQMRWGETWYQGTADAVYQNLNLLLDFAPDLVAIFGSDHIYRMDITQMLSFAQERRADITVAALPVPVNQASSFGIIATEPDGRIVRFEEKPTSPTSMPGDPTRCLASMGNYLFTRDVLVDALIEDARRSTDHDFGRTILPELVPHARVYAYNFLDNALPGIQPYEEVGYWRDIGTIEAYWQAHMDLLGRTPKFELANRSWPIHTAPYRGPSARIVDGTIVDCQLGEGSIIDGATVRRSILGRDVRLLPGAIVDESVLLDHTVVGVGAQLRRVIADRYNMIEGGTRLGVDGSGGEAGITVLPRGPTRARE